MGLEPDIDAVTTLRHPMVVMIVKVPVRISYIRALFTLNAQVRKLQFRHIANLVYIYEIIPPQIHYSHLKFFQSKFSVEKRWMY